MEGLKRTIGYVKPKAEEVAPVVSGNSSDRVLDWIAAHPLFKVKAMCLEVGIDPGNFHRTVKGRKEIAPDALQKIIPIIKKYGYVE